MQCVVRHCLQKEGRGRGWQDCSTQSERLQGGPGVVDLGGGEGEMSGGVAQRGGVGEGCGVGDGLFEQRLGGAGAVQVEQRLGAVVEQRGVGIFSGLRLG